MDKTEFRKKLDEITVVTTPKEQPNVLAKLSYQCAHNITLLSNPLTVDHSFDEFDYVFRDILRSKMWGDIESKRKDKGHSGFIREFIDKGCLELHDEKHEKDKIAVYFSNGIPKHFGKVEGRNFSSKWGSGGHVWRHKLWEVPESYGDDVRYSSGQMDTRALEEILNGTEEDPEKRI